MKQIIYIQGMTCGSCVAKVKELFKETFGITDINIEKDAGKVTYEHDVFLTNSDITKMLS
jgi:copper chaperone CopZ